MAEVKARGSNFVYTKKYILQEHGPEKTVLKGRNF